MDLASILGLVAAFGFILLGQALEGGHAGSLVQATAFIIVIGGTIGACMVHYPMKDFLAGLKMAKLAFTEKKVEMGGTLEELVTLAALSRREGLIALESKIGEIKDKFLARTLEHAVDGVSAADLRNLMENDVAHEEEEMKAACGLWETAGGYCPCVGIVGAVLGLIHVMENLDDPSKLGPGIAVAFVATVYGVASANIIFLPMASKLKRKIHHEMVKKAMIIDGVCAIIEGVNSSVLKKRLHMYVAHEGKHDAKGGH
ncbi:MAG: flagellar motor protein [Planctomycetes bacterium]|nr:flagellar motor protein [Planctomycetota bacterium]